MIRGRISSLILLILAMAIPATGSPATNLDEVGKRFGSQCALEHPDNQPDQSECVKEKCEATYTDNRQRMMCQVKALEALMALAVPDPQKRKVFDDLLRLPKGKTIGRACVSEHPHDFTSQKHCIEQACSKWFTGDENAECQSSCLKVLTQAARPSKPLTTSEDTGSNEIFSEGSIKSRCVRLSPGDYQKQVICFNQQAEAANNLSTLMSTYPGGSKERNIIFNCKTPWRDGDTYDFVAIMNCSNRQL